MKSMKFEQEKPHKKSKYSTHRGEEIKGGSRIYGQSRDLNFSQQMRGETLEGLVLLPHHVEGQSTNTRYLLAINVKMTNKKAASLLASRSSCFASNHCQFGTPRSQGCLLKEISYFPFSFYGFLLPRPLHCVSLFLVQSAIKTCCIKFSLTP